MTATAAPRFLSGLARHWAIWREARRADKSRPKTKLHGPEREFLPAAIEIMGSPPRPWAAP